MYDFGFQLLGPLLLPLPDATLCGNQAKYVLDIEMRYGRLATLERIYFKASNGYVVIA